MQYIKLTDGRVSFLVNIEDTRTIEDKLNEGFKPERDKDNKIVTKELSDIITSDNIAVQSLLDELNGKVEVKKEEVVDTKEELAAIQKEVTGSDKAVSKK